MMRRDTGHQVTSCLTCRCNRRGSTGRCLASSFNGEKTIGSRFILHHHPSRGDRTRTPNAQLLLLSLLSPQGNLEERKHIIQL